MKRGNLDTQRHQGCVSTEKRPGEGHTEGGHLHGQGEKSQKKPNLPSP